MVAARVILGPEEFKSSSFLSTEMKRITYYFYDLRACNNQIVELMGGAIGVDSCEGRGSLFWFTAGFSLASSADSLSLLESLPSNMTVAVAARNATVRGVLFHRLCAYGLLPASAIAAPSVAEVEALFAERGPPTVLIVCVQGPAQPRGRDTCGRGGNELHRTPEDCGAVWRAAGAEVAAALERHSCMRGVVLCPPEGLGQLAQLKHHPRCVLLSRPTRSAALHGALFGKFGPSQSLSLHEDQVPSPQRSSAGGDTRPSYPGSDGIFVPTLAGDSCRRSAALRCDDAGAGLVLVVDDDEGQRRVIKLMLEREGFKVRVPELLL